MLHMLCTMPHCVKIMASFLKTKSVQSFSISSCLCFQIDNHNKRSTPQNSAVPRASPGHFQLLSKNPVMGPMPASEWCQTKLTFWKVAHLESWEANIWKVGSLMGECSWKGHLLSSG